MRPVMERLWAKVDQRGPDECWPFTGSTSAHGYGRVGLGSRAQGNAQAHRLVTEATYGPAPTPDAQARHLCGNRACCNPAHLAWGDQAANEADKLLHDRSNRGTRHGMAKLEECAVREIRARYQRGDSQRVIAHDYGVRQQTISDIVHGRTWGWMA